MMEAIRKTENVQLIVEKLHREAMKRIIENQVIYIPLQATYAASTEKQSFDLTIKLKEFFVFEEDNPRDPTVMLLLGDAGSGKSVFAQQLFQQCWQDFKIGSPIPVWISLPELDSPFERAVEEAFEKCGLTESQIETLKSTERFLFIVDGYDELHNFQNCYESNHWSRWKAKVLITCRTQALYYQRDYEQYFIPFERGERQSWLLTKLYVAPFNQDQISAYIERYQVLNPDQKLSQDDLAKVPNLKQLITSPFMLHIAVECLSEILAKHPQEKLLQVNLYDIYIERWFTREAKKVAVVNKQEESLKKRFWHYCKDLAVEMHSRKLDVIPYSQRSGGRFGNKQPVSIWERFFTVDTLLERSACPLRSYGDNYYGFVHATLVNYFATRTMYELSIYENKVDEKVEKGNEKEELKETPKYQAQFKHPIHRVLFTQDPESVQMLAERTQQNPMYKQEMLWCIEASKKHKGFAIAAANAITALVRAGVTFNGADLRGIQIPGADLSGGFFDCANFKEADLRDVKLNRVWMRDANLQDCLLGGIQFGEFPWFSHGPTYTHQPMATQDPIQSIAYRDDLNKLLTAHTDNIWEWNILKRQCIKKIPIRGAKVESISLSQDGKILIYGLDNKTVHIINLSRGNSTILRGEKGHIYNVRIREDDLISVSNYVEESLQIPPEKANRVVMLWGTTSVCLSQDAFTAVAGERFAIRVWDLLKGESRALLGHTGLVNCVQLSGDGRTLASGGQDKTVRIWTLENGEAKVLEGRSSISCVCLSADNQALVAGEGNTLRVWDLGRYESKELRGHNQAIRSACFSRDALTVISGSDDSTIRIWNLKSDQMRILTGHVAPVQCVCLSQDNQTVISGSRDKTVRVWEIESGLNDNKVQSDAKLNMFRQSISKVSSVCLTHDGHTIVSVCSDNTVRLWNIISGESKVLSSHDENKVVTGREDNSIPTRNLFSAKLAVLQGHDKGVNSVCISQLGDLIVCGSSDKTIRIWSIKTGEMKVLKGHEKEVNSVCINQLRDIIVSGSSDKTVRIWSIKTGGMKVLEGHTDTVNGVSLSEDGFQLFSWNAKEVFIWKVENGEKLKQFKHFQIAKLQVNKQGNMVFAWRDDEQVFVSEIPVSRENQQRSVVDMFSATLGKNQKVTGHKSWINTIHIGDDGKTIVSSSSSTVVIGRIGEKESVILPLKSVCAIATLTESFPLVPTDQPAFAPAFERRDYVAFGKEDGSIQLWQKQSNDEIMWQLKWSSDSQNPNRALELSNCHIEGAQGLSHQNRLLIEQRSGLVNEISRRSTFGGHSK